jgi:hypothetical protein
MILRCLCHAALAAAMLSPTAPAQTQETEVVPFDAEWDWLMILQPGSSAQVDPVSVDPDFLQTWTTAAYNGPAFQRDPAPLRYGVLDFLSIGSSPPGTLLSSPAPGTRGAVYCRTTFDLPGELTNLKLEFLVDDGFILFVDGVQWVSMNMGAGATSAFGEVAPAPGNESSLSTISAGAGGVSPLPALLAGRHTLHLSLHNVNLTSSDLGFMLRLSGDLRRILVPTLTAEASAPSIDGSPRLLLRAKGLGPSAPAIVQMSTDLSQWFPLFESPPAPERTELSLDLPAGAGRRFFRLVQ